MQAVAVLGTIRDNAASGPGISWTVDLVKSGSASGRRIGAGTGGVTSGIIARVDPTVLINDNYELLLTVDKAGQKTAFRAPYEIASDFKPGNYTVSFTDIVVPVAGIPMAITREYTSFEESKGEFGAGWRLKLPGRDLTRRARIRSSRSRRELECT